MAVGAKTVTITSPVGEGLLFRRMVGREELGRLFELELLLESEDRTLAFADLVGEKMTVHLELADGSKRHWNGVISRFGLVGETDRRATYRATLRPWTWILTHRARCQIYQNKTVPEVIKDIFREHGQSDFRESLSGTYAASEYRVQYRETDFDFVSRLMEEEGIYYYFEHEDGRHVLVLADSPSAHATISGYDTIPYYPPLEDVRRERDHIDTWAIAEELKPGAYFLEDFDFTRPKANLEVKLVSRHPLAKSALEIYDYPGRYVERSNGETYVKVRLEELYAQQELVRGEGDARGISPGALFTLSGHPRDDQNREHLVVSAEYDLSVTDYETSGAPAEEQKHVFRCRFTAIDGQRQFRPARITPKPRVYGPQTAIVVGKSGEEIWTDEYGRVRVQFHWDRLGESNEKSSCWVRVAQIWAGAKWGAIHIPRVGQEVVVDFLEGDPDRPIVTGRLYNADNMPPYALPQNMTQSGIKSRSTKGGSAENFNEIRFEDKKGEEHIFVQAEKDLETLVKNDEKRTVNHDRTTTIKNDETVTVEGQRTETVKKDETITIEGQRTETVKKDETITVEGQRTETVKKDETITVEGKRTETVKKDETVAIEGKRTVEIGKDDTLTVTGKRTQTIQKSDKLEVSQKLEVSAGQELVLKVGAATITLKSSGDIVIKGANVQIDAGAKATIKASAEVGLSAPAIKGG